MIQEEKEEDDLAVLSPPKQSSKKSNTSIIFCRLIWIGFMFGLIKIVVGGASYAVFNNISGHKNETKCSWGLGLSNGLTDTSIAFSGWSLPWPNDKCIDWASGIYLVVLISGVMSDGSVIVSTGICIHELANIPNTTDYEEWSVKKNGLIAAQSILALVALAHLITSVVSVVFLCRMWNEKEQPEPIFFYSKSSSKSGRSNPPIVQNPKKLRSLRTLRRFVIAECIFGPYMIVYNANILNIVIRSASLFSPREESVFCMFGMGIGIGAGVLSIAKAGLNFCAFRAPNGYKRLVLAYFVMSNICIVVDIIIIIMAGCCMNVTVKKMNDLAGIDMTIGAVFQLLPALIHAVCCIVSNAMIYRNYWGKDSNTQQFKIVTCVSHQQSTPDDPLNETCVIVTSDHSSITESGSNMFIGNQRKEWNRMKRSGNMTGIVWDAAFLVRPARRKNYYDNRTIFFYDTEKTMYY